MTQRLSARFICLGLCVGLISIHSIAIAEDTSFSRANTLLFYTDHLANVSAPNTIHYTFVNRGAETEGFSDAIELRVTEASKDGHKNVSLNYLTGSRHQYVPPIPNSKGNPILKVFLQRDVHEMGRLTRGPWRHFQNRIKLAFAHEAQISPVTFRFNGKDAHGLRIRIEPYRNDPKRGRFEKYANKYYEFTLSEDVPGMIYEIRAVVPSNTQPNGEHGIASLNEAVLTFNLVTQ